VGSVSGIWTWPRRIDQERAFRRRYAWRRARLQVNKFNYEITMNELQIVKNFYAALGSGDMPAVLGLLDAAVQWTEAERFPYYSGTWVGPQAVLDNLLKRLAADWSDFSAKADDFVSEGSRVVALGQYAGTYRRTGKSMTASFAHVWKVRDDKIISFQMHTDTAKVLEALRD
jgi:ketosteroid isomerase-like protein